MAEPTSLNKLAEAIAYICYKGYDKKIIFNDDILEISDKYEKLMDEGNHKEENQTGKKADHWSNIDRSVRHCCLLFRFDFAQNNHNIIGAMSENHKDTYRLRPKERVNIFARYNLQEEDLDEAIEEDEYRNNAPRKHSRPKRAGKNKRSELEKDYEVDISEAEVISESDIYDNNAIIDRLPESPQELEALLKKVKDKIKYYKL